MPRKKKSRGRRVNGEGSLYQLSDGRWCYAITFRGETKPRYFTAKDAEEAVRKKDEALATLTQNGFLPKKNKLTVSEWMDFWMNNYKVSDLEETGWESYENEIELRIKPHIGSILLPDLRPLDVQQWVNKLSKSGRRDGKGGLAPKTVARSYGILRQALDKAVEQELIISNPAAKKLINLPKIPKPKIKHMTVDDAAAFLEAIKDDYMYPAIVTDLMIGLRRGELLGVKWKDFDLNKKGTVIVRRQLIRKTSGECKLVERVKTDTGYRELQLPPELIAILKKHKQQQWEQKQKLTGITEKPTDSKVVAIKSRKDPQGEDLVFCWPDGRWYSPDHLYRHLQRLLKKHGFEKLTVHGLRHTYATSAVALGTDLSVVSNNMGHSVIATTTIYLHSDREREKAAAAKMGNALLKKPKRYTITNRITNKPKNMVRKAKEAGR
ncbi:MAG: site-specific integrase [Syntrophomonadaceae bacterium]|jgi:integrase|nr:site-specific integrase [Syntrophomonadaceae bacterium]